MGSGRQSIHDFYNDDEKEKDMRTIQKNHNSSNGTGVMGLLGVAFVVLKLTGVIDWSWWLVTLPFYGGLIIFFVMLCFVFLHSFIKGLKK